MATRNKGEGNSRAGLSGLDASFLYLETPEQPMHRLQPVHLRNPDASDAIPESRHRDLKSGCTWRRSFATVAICTIPWHLHWSMLMNFDLIISSRLRSSCRRTTRQLEAAVEGACRN